MQHRLNNLALGLIFILCGSALAAAPGAFNLIAPTDFSLDVDIYPKLEWQASTGAESYVVRIGRSGSFTPGSYVDFPADTNVSWPIQDLQKGSIQYYWKVAAIASNGAGGYDTTWSSRWQMQTIPLTMPTRIDQTDEIINPRTLLAANSPYTIRISAACSSLTVPAGTTILLGRNAIMTIKGSFIANGTQTNPIRIDYDSSDAIGNYTWAYINVNSQGQPVVVDANHNYVSGSVLQWVNVSGGGSISSGTNMLVNQVHFEKAAHLDLTGSSIVKDSRFVRSGYLRGAQWVENVRIDSGYGGWVSQGTTTELTTVKNLQILGNSGFGFQYNRTTPLDARQLNIQGNSGGAMSVNSASTAHLQDINIDWHSQVNRVSPIPKGGNNGGDLALCGIDYQTDPIDWSILWEVHTGSCSYPSSAFESARMYGSYLNFVGADTFMTKQLEGPKYNGYYLDMAMWGSGDPHFQWQDELGTWHTIRKFPDTTITGDYVRWYDSLYIPGKPERIRIITSVPNKTMRINFFELYTASTSSYTNGLQLTGSANAQYTLRNISIKNNSGKGLSTSGTMQLDMDSITVDRGDSTGVEINHIGQTKIRRLQSLNNKRNGFVHLSGSDTLDLKHSLFAGNRNGGMRIQSIGTGLVDSCVFENDSAFATGGGMHIASLGMQMPARLTVSNSRFKSNRSGNDGGGMFIDTNSAVNLVNLTFEQNFAVGNGGGLRTKSLQAPVNNLKFIGDSANGLGGGAYLPIAPENCAFLMNSANQGGGLYLYRPVDRLALNSFVQNKTNSASSQGAALYLNQNVRKVEWNLFNGNYNSGSVIYGHIDSLRQNNLDRNPQISTIYRNSTGVDVLGTQNWWGTRSDQIAIEGYLYHKVDLNTLGLVTYQPFLSNPSDSVPGAVRNVSSVKYYQDSLYTIPAMGYYTPGTVNMWLELRGEDTNPFAYDPVVVVVENSRTFSSVAPILVETDLNSGIYRGKARIGSPTDLATNTLEANSGDSLYLYWYKNSNIGEWVKLATAPNRAPIAGTIGSKVVLAGSALQVNLPAVDPDGDPLTWTITLQPGNLNFNVGALSTWSWSPQASQVGVYTATATVSDGTLSDQVIFEVEVQENPVPLNQQPPKLDRQWGKGWIQVQSTQPVRILVLSLNGRIYAQGYYPNAGTHRLHWNPNGVVVIHVISSGKKWSWMQAE